jgi:hypothetical protein
VLVTQLDSRIVAQVPVIGVDIEYDPSIGGELAYLQDSNRRDVVLGIEQALPRRAVIWGIGIPSNAPKMDAAVPENPEVDDDRHIAFTHHET